MTLTKIHLRWAIAAAVGYLFFGSVGYYGGWKANIEQSYAEHLAVQKILREHDPLMQKVQDTALLDATQQVRLTTLETSVGELVAKMDKLTDLLIEQHQREAFRRHGP